MHGAGHKGKLPPVVERALSWYADHGGMVAESPGGGKDFRSEAGAGRDQESEIREASANPDLHMPGFGLFFAVRQ